MTIAQIHKLNEKFQEKAIQLSEFIPSGTFVKATSELIRSSRKIDEQLVKLISTKNESDFHLTMDQLEDETDKTVFILDQLEIANSNQKISLINDFLYEGYHLMSVYSEWLHQIIDKKVKEKDSE